MIDISLRPRGESTPATSVRRGSARSRSWPTTPWRTAGRGPSSAPSVGIGSHNRDVRFRLQAILHQIIWLFIMRMSHAECKTKDISDFKHNIWYDLWILMQASLNHHMRRHQEKARRTEQFKESGEGCDDQRYSCVHEGDHEQQSVMKTLSEQSTLMQVDIVTSHGESEKWI